MPNCCVDCKFARGKMKPCRKTGMLCSTYSHACKWYGQCAASEDCFVPKEVRMTQRRNKKYMRRIPVGGILGTVVDIDWAEDGGWITVDVQNQDDVFIMKRPPSITHEGQRVRISIRPI